MGYTVRHFSILECVSNLTVGVDPEEKATKEEMLPSSDYTLCVYRIFKWTCIMQIFIFLREIWYPISVCRGVNTNKKWRGIKLNFSHSSDYKFFFTFSFFTRPLFSILLFPASFSFEFTSFFLYRVFPFFASHLHAIFYYDNVFTYNKD